MELVFLILQLALGKHDETIGIGLQALQRLFDLGQWGGRQVEQALAVAEQIAELFC